MTTAPGRLRRQTDGLPRRFDERSANTEETQVAELGIFSAVAQTIEQPVLRLFGLVREALSRATWALLNGDPQLGQEVIDGDQEIDDAAAAGRAQVWSRLEAGGHTSGNLRAPSASS